MNGGEAVKKGTGCWSKNATPTTGTFTCLLIILHYKRRVEIAILARKYSLVVAILSGRQRVTITHLLGKRISHTPYRVPCS